MTGRESSPCYCGRFTLAGADEPQSCGDPSCRPGREASAECPACAGYEDGPYRDLCDSCRAEVLRGERPTGGDDD